MKKLLLLVALLWAGNVSAQITLDKAFDGAFNISKINATDYRIVVTEPDSTFSIYTLSYTLEKHITPPKVKGKLPISVDNLSLTTFNTDNKYEYIATYFISGSYVDYIYSEDGSTIFQANGLINGIYNLPTGTKMKVGKNIYSLPGTYYTVAIHPTIDNTGSISVYPNPSTNEVVIKGNHTGTVLITNIAGQQLISIPYHDGLIIPTSNYVSGIYLVSLYSENGVFTEKVEIKH